MFCLDQTIYTNVQHCNNHLKQVQTQPRLWDEVTQTTEIACPEFDNMLMLEDSIGLVATDRLF